MGGQTTSYLYTADGVRLLRRDSTHTVLYLGDTELRCQRSTGTVAGTRYYSFAGHTVAVRQGSSVTWLADDHHGTASFAVNSSDLSVTRRRMLPFGGPRGAAVGWPGERWFVGGTVDPSTGLTLIGARYYDPAIGRFSSVDPVMDLADPQQMHGYTYSNNNPVTWSDPTGLWCDSCNNGQGWPDEHGYFPSKVDSDGRPNIDYNSPKYKGMTGRASKLFIDGSDAYRMGQLDPIPGFRPRKECGDTICSIVRGFFAGAACTLVGGPVAGDLCAGAAFGATEAANHGENPVTGAVEGAVTALAVGAALRAVLDAAATLIAKGRGGGEALPNPSCRNSFTPETLVPMADGTYKPIAEVKVGENVLATDPNTAQTGAQEVTATIVGTGEKQLVEVTIDVDGDQGDTTGVILATSGHLFWQPDFRRWTTVGKLAVGSLIQTSAGTWVRIITVRKWTAARQVNSLTIRGVHTYYVLAGQTPILVHNDNDWSVPDDYLVVRGGQSPMPATGQVFSGSIGRSVNEASAAVPHGSIRATTAGQIRAAGGTVTYAPEQGPGGAMNYNHVNVTLGDTNPSGELEANPTPMSGPMTSEALGSPRC